MVEIINPVFREAVSDYYHLLNRGYAEKPAAKLVSDRYRLDSMQRLVLYRGITSRDKAASRKTRITHHLAGERLVVDGYNVIFTIMNYLSGKLVFIANDGLMRDCGQDYGKIKNPSLFERSLHLLFDYLQEQSPGDVIVYFDRPVTASEEHLKLARDHLLTTGLKAETHLVQDVDKECINEGSGVIATSDSEIVDKAGRMIVDPARAVLETVFGVHPVDFGVLVTS